MPATNKGTKWLAAALLLAAAPAGAQEPTTIAELWQIVERQQQEIEALRAQLDVTDDRVESTSAQLQETDALATATSDLVESLDVADAAPRTTIGGYGELHYNEVKANDAVNDLEEIDFHRFVLFFGRRFTDRISFYSELELEHSLSGDGEPGEVELEQAYLDFAVSDALSAKAGLFLLPIGILNETHEPPTFFGVERNAVENIIIPSTWWEAGSAVSGRLANGWSWDIAVHSGLAIPVTGSNAFRVRSGRQKVAEAVASDFAYTGTIRYTGIPGLEWAASYQHQTDPSQVPGDGLDSGHLFSTHLDYRRDRLGLRALYGQWLFDGAAVEAAGADRQTGWYVEPSFRLGPKWGIYARLEELEGARDADKFDEWQVGASFWPTPAVVVKVDYRQRDFTRPALAGEDFDAIDVGVGYQF